MDIRNYNREAWNRQVEVGNRWTTPVSSQAVANARKDRWEILLTPSRPVPREWFPSLAGTAVLCLASGGGQQGPILAATGADVTVFDNSPRQLEEDRVVAEREGLQLQTVEGDMRDLSSLSTESFDLIIHPVSNLFVPEIRPVWREAFRVLRPDGFLLSGFDNPVRHTFDDDSYDQGDLIVAHALPYSQAESLSAEALQQIKRDGIPLEFGHTLADQIGGQIDAGFAIVGFYEDRFPPEDRDPLGRYMSSFLATRARRSERAQVL